MSGPFGSSQWQYSSGGSFYGYEINNSLRFEDADSAALSWTPSSSGNQQTFTFSSWIKLANPQSITSNEYYFSASNSFRIGFLSDATLYVQTSSTTYFGSNELFRDFSAWYHIVWAVDTTASDSTNRVKVYVNGVQITSWDYSTYPSQNANLPVNTSSYTFRLGNANISGTNYFYDGYIADAYFIDGEQLEPTSFGETKSGIWIPKQYSGSYGTNGFHLDFADSSNFGNDVSGQGNDFSSSGVNTHDQVTDTPTSNFCTLNPLTCGTYPTLIDGNLRISTMYSADLSGCTSTWYVDSGKWYWEVHLEGNTLTYPIVGITDQRQTLAYTTRGSFYSLAWRRGTGVSLATTYMGTITKRNSASTTNDDIIMFALDAGARKIWIGKNGTWNSDGDPETGANPDGSWTLTVPVSPSIMGYQSQGVNSVFNFGQDGTFAGNQTAQGNSDDNGIGDFYYSPPSGFLAMATPNLEAVIDPASDDKPSNYFNTVLYTGTGATQSITGVGFQPDWTWVKRRAGIQEPSVTDSVRGVNAQLRPAATAAESAQTDALTSFDSDGFTLGADATNRSYNYYTDAHVAWNWLAGNSTSSNTDGSLTSTVSVNTDAGFSVGTVTTANRADTIGHGLSQAPDMVIFKPRTGALSWGVYHSSFSSADNYLFLESTNGTGSSSAYWNSTAPTSTVFSIGSTWGTHDAVFYAFHSVAGYSKTGKYRGTSSTNGAYVHCGFRPAWVLIKSTSSGTDWCIYDNKRIGYNVDNNLQRNVSAAEQTDDDIDFLAHGFKCRRSSTNFNNSSYDYVFIAFAEQPFKFANAR